MITLQKASLIMTFAINHSRKQNRILRQCYKIRLQKASLIMTFAINYRYKQGCPAQYAPIRRSRGFQVGVNAPSAIMKALMGRRRGKTAVSAKRVPEGFSSNHGILSRLCVRKFVNKYKEK